MHTPRASGHAPRRNPRQNRKQLHVYKGDLPDAVDYVAETSESAEYNKALNIHGVEKAEEHEHHLQAALANDDLRHTSDNPIKSPTLSHKITKPPPPKESYKIPTPAINANAQYDDFYPPKKYRHPEKSYIRSSEKVEEVSHGLGGLNYVLDEKDLAWLNEFNEKDQGASADAAQNGSTVNGGAAASSHSGRPIRNKGKDREKEPTAAATVTGPFKIGEDDFEYIMGMFELWCEKNVPMLHTDLSLVPEFTGIEPVFAETLPASYFPSYEVPQGLPRSSQLVRMARNVYPYWKKRKIARQGKTIIPILNFDESDDSDPYVCFRRRDIKEKRKTRNKDTSSIDRMTKIQVELANAAALVRLVFDREREKTRALRAEREVFEAKWNLLDLKRKYPQLAISAEEENLLFPHRKETSHIPSANSNQLFGFAQKKQRLEREREREREDSQRLAGSPAPGGVMKGLRSRAQSPVAEKIPPEQLAAIVQKKVQEDMKRKKEADFLWEDSPDLAPQPLHVPTPIRHFRCLPPSENVAKTKTPRSPSPTSSDRSRPSSPITEGFRSNRQICFRLRRGRGGITRLDRKFPSFHQSSETFDGGKESDPISRLFPRHPFSRQRKHSDPDEENGRDEESLKAKNKWLEAIESEESRILSERWRYDADQGRVGIGMGSNEEDPVIIDDYGISNIKLRSFLVTVEDLESFLPSLQAIKKVQHALAQPPEKPPQITFQRNIPQQPAQIPMQAAQMSSQQIMAQQMLAAQQQQLIAQQNHARLQVLQQQAQQMQQGQQQQGQQQQVPQQQQQARNSSVPPVNAVMGPPTVVPNGQQVPQQPQIRRIMSNGVVGAMGPPARPNGSPATAMQALPQQGTPNLVNAAVASRQSQSPQVYGAMVQQALQRQAQQQQQGDQGQLQQQGQPIPAEMVTMVNGRAMTPAAAAAHQATVMALHNRTPASLQAQLPNGVQTPIQHHQQPTNSASPISNASQVQQSPRQQPMGQQLANGIQNMPNGMMNGMVNGLPNGVNGADGNNLAQMALLQAMQMNGNGNIQLTPAQQVAAMKALMQSRNGQHNPQLQQQMAAMMQQAGMVNGAASPGGTPNGMANALPSGQMPLRLPPGRNAQFLNAQQAAGSPMRAGGSPVTVNGSPHLPQAQAQMSVGGPGR